MTNRIRITAVLVILCVLICSFIALHIASQMEVKEVSSISMNSSTSDTVTLRWHKVKNADGYKVLVLGENDEYELLTTVEDGEANEVTLTELSPATVYDFKMSAFRIYRGKEYESEISEEYAECYTLAATPQLRVSVKEPYSFSVSWSAQKNVSGYEVEYSQSEEFNGSKTTTVTENSFTLTDLKERDTYYARCRAFFEYNGNKVYSEWSEIASGVVIKKVVMNSDIDPDKPMIAFTFDDGPNYETTPLILDTLEEYNARATFFMVGNRVPGCEYILERELEIGCELGNHTMTHKNYGSSVTVSDISDASDTIYDACGQYPSMFRCPGGIITATIQRECYDEGMPLAYWSVDTQDWKLKDAEKVYDNIIDSVYDGCIVLMHDIYEPTAEAVANAVPELVRQGYQIVTVSELIYYKTGESAQAGEQYVDCDTINNYTD